MKSRNLVSLARNKPASTFEHDLMNNFDGLTLDHACTMVNTLFANHAASGFGLGAVLHEIKKRELFSPKYKNWTAFVESPCVPFGEREARMYIGTYERLTDAHIDWTAVRHLGWTKLAVIAKHLTTDNVQELVALAEGRTVQQLKQHFGPKTGNQSPVAEPVIAHTSALADAHVPDESHSPEVVQAAQAAVSKAQTTTIVFPPNPMSKNNDEQQLRALMRKVGRQRVQALVDELWSAVVEEPA